jgi:hypothetical protein
MSGYLVKIVKQLYVRSRTSDGQSVQLQSGFVLNWKRQSNEVAGELPALSLARKGERPSDKEVEIVGRALRERLGRAARFKHEEVKERGLFVRRLVVLCDEASHDENEEGVGMQGTLF